MNSGPRLEAYGCGCRMDNVPAQKTWRRSEDNGGNAAAMRHQSGDAHGQDSQNCHENHKDGRGHWEKLC